MHSVSINHLRNCRVDISVARDQIKTITDFVHLLIS